jgi:crotonobetainyl-CoA:carnitine CoA-transferase CaiB-like acyl-CoA transferase
MAVPLRFSGTPTGERAPAPRLGEQSEAILAEAGYGEAEIAALLQGGAVRQAA